MKRMVYKIYNRLLDFKKMCKSAKHRLFFVAKDKPVEAGMLFVSVCMLMVSVLSIGQTYLIWKYNDESSNKQHEEKSAQDVRYAFQDYILKNKLNEIEIKQEAAVQKVGTILDKSAVITEQIAESNKRQADIANRMIAQSEANIEMRGGAISFPKNYLSEYSHNDYAPDSTVVMVMLTINNKSSEPIDILGSGCKFYDGVIVDRSWCGAISVKDTNGDIVKLNPWAEIYDNWGTEDWEITNEVIQKFVGDYYANLHEYPMSFHMKPFEEKIGFMFFHRDTVFQPNKDSIKLGIRTNRGFFHKEFQLEPFI